MELSPPRHTTDLAARRALEMQAQVRAARLAALAARCCPSLLRRAASATVTWLRRGQLGPGYVACR